MKLSLIITHVQHIIQYRGYNTVEHIRLSTYQILLFRLLKFLHNIRENINGNARVILSLGGIPRVPIFND